MSDQSSIFPGRYWTPKVGLIISCIPGAAARPLGALARLDLAKFGHRSFHDSIIMEALMSWR